MPKQISTTLCKAHNAGLLQPIENGNDIQQIETGPVWHGMALDLMLGNLYQAMNTAQIVTLFALANLYHARPIPIKRNPSMKRKMAGNALYCNQKRAESARLQSRFGTSNRNEPTSFLYAIKLHSCAEAPQ